MRQSDHDRLIRLEATVATLKAVVFGAVGLILTAVVGSLVALVLRP